MPTWFKVALVFTCLYLFMVGIGAMSASFKLMGSDFSRDLLAQGSRAKLVSLFIGILATTLVQSSSASTAAIVGLVAAGGIPFESACFMVMGANVGRGWVLDLSQKKDIAKVIGEIADHFGGIDILVNNAGISIPAPIDSDEYEDAWDKVLTFFESELKGE